MTYINRDSIATLETLIDQCTLAHVVGMLADVCADKAEHIRENWQDFGTARSWNRDGRKLERLKLEN